MVACRKCGLEGSFWESICAGCRGDALEAGLAAAKAELAAIRHLRDLPPGAPVPEHEGEAYAVAVKLRARGDTFAIDYARLEAKYVDETEALRARVAELEADNGRLRAALEGK